MLYPLLLDITCANVLVVGAGSVGERKLATLATAAPQSVTVVDPCLSLERQSFFAQRFPITFHFFERAFTAADVEGKTLVFAATSSLGVNKEIADICAAKGILCNSATVERNAEVADVSSSTRFVVPAAFSSSGLTVTVSTGGHSPALARRVKEDLEVFVSSRYGTLLTLLSRVREPLLALGLSSDENARILRSIARSSLGELLDRNENGAAAEMLTALLPPPMHPFVGELFHGL